MIVWKRNTLYLETAHTSYIMRVLSNGMLQHVYYGARIPQEDMDYYQLFRERSFSPMIQVEGREASADTIPQEYPVFGRGDFRRPALVVETADGRIVNELLYQSHEIVSGKPTLAGLPSLDVDTRETASLSVTLSDTAGEYEVVLHYSVFEKEDIIARCVEIRNIGKEGIWLREAASLSLDFERKDFTFLSLSGAWARERQVSSRPLGQGTTSIESRRGASSHQLNPFAALTECSATETSGEVYGFALVYSGDFRIGAEVNQFGSTRLQAGLNPETCSWYLEPGERFLTPEGLMTYSDHGLGEMSRHFHDVCRRHLGKCASQTGSHPILINSWETMYFDISEEKIRKLLESCQGLGIDTFVLDDGWFGHRRDDTSSLGDWFVNEEKFAGGLERITRLCGRYGMKFGIWIEPEMISRDSRLYAEHPDWCIHGCREPVESRNQLVLDLSRQEVVEEIYERIASLLQNYAVSYVKWDCNRNLTDIGSDSLPRERQREYSHRHMLGVYRLMDRLTKAFPDVCFEGCSGGGGRFDFGMLYYMPQIWTSDDSDAVERQKIQYGTSLVYPPAAMTAHVSACPNHQTGRTTPFGTRGETAQMCGYGYELNVGVLSEEERAQIREQVKRHKELEPLLYEGDFYRLKSPFTSELCAWELVARDQTRAYVFVGFQRAIPNYGGEYLRLQGLKAEGRYCIRQLGTTQSGDTLMKAGLPVLMPEQEYGVAVFDLEMELEE